MSKKEQGVILVKDAFHLQLTEKQVTNPGIRVCHVCVNVYCHDTVDGRKMRRSDTDSVRTFVTGIEQCPVYTADEAHVPQKRATLLRQVGYGDLV